MTGEIKVLFMLNVLMEGISILFCLDKNPEIEMWGAFRSYVTIFFVFQPRDGHRVSSL